MPRIHKLLLSSFTFVIIGVAAALYPRAWLSLFGDDPAMIAVGSDYLRIVGPFYGFFGVGLSLYFASQGAGRLGWPLIAASLRVAIAAAGGFVALALFGITGVFWALALALAAFGIIVAAAIAGGAWFPKPPSSPKAAPTQDPRLRGAI